MHVVNIFVPFDICIWWAVGSGRAGCAHDHCAQALYLRSALGRCAVRSAAQMYRASVEWVYAPYTAGHYARTRHFVLFITRLSCWDWGGVCFLVCYLPIYPIYRFLLLSLSPPLSTRVAKQSVVFIVVNCWLSWSMFIYLLASSIKCIT